LVVISWSAIYLHFGMFDPHLLCLSTFLLACVVFECSLCHLCMEWLLFLFWGFHGDLWEEVTKVYSRFKEWKRGEQNWNKILNLRPSVSSKEINGIQNGLCPWTAWMISSTIVAEIPTHIRNIITHAQKVGVIVLPKTFGFHGTAWKTSPDLTSSSLTRNQSFPSDW